MSKFVEKYLILQIPTEEYYAFDSRDGMAFQVRRFILEENEAIRAGKRERPHGKKEYMVKTCIGMTSECLAAVENIMKFYGLKTYSEAIRISISNGFGTGE